MNHIRLLDCTLRDGGYINDWQFGENNIQTVLYGLVSARVDLAEIGYLSGVRDFDRGSTQFSDIAYANSILPKEKNKTKFVGMIDYGKIKLQEIYDYDQNGIYGIRIAFHKKDLEGAVQLAKEIKGKGYKIFLQPMATLCYNDQELLSLIEKANQLEPEAYYLVDSFGAMKLDDLMHLIYIVDYNLKPGIQLGLHSHNNLQLSYSLAQTLCNQRLKRDLIIDSSIYGMGRGAGNLNTELFAEYLNEVFESNYNIQALLRIADNVIAPIYQKKNWGYSLPFYLSATHNCHPNYAVYLDNKNTLTAENMEEIFSLIDRDQKNLYDKDYIQTLYLQYQSVKQPIVNHEDLQKDITGKDILIIAPGKSVIDEQEKVRKASKGKTIIALNHVPSVVKADYIFVSNHRRWENMKKTGIPQVILTSNIRFDTAGAYIVDYAPLLNDIDAVKDNAGMLLIELLIRMRAKHIYLTGLDGYSTGSNNNFADPKLEFSKQDSVMMEMNEGMSIMIRRFKERIPIDFVTRPRFVVEG